MTETQTKTIGIYNENCVMAGRAVPQWAIDEQSGGDWTEHELTEEEAAFWENRGRYGARIAATIRENL